MTITFNIGLTEEEYMFGLCFHSFTKWMDVVQDPDSHLPREVQYRKCIFCNKFEKRFVEK